MLKILRANYSKNSKNLINYKKTWNAAIVIYNKLIKKSMKTFRQNKN